MPCPCASYENTETPAPASLLNTAPQPREPRQSSQKHPAARGGDRLSIACCFAGPSYTDIRLTGGHMVSPAPRPQHAFRAVPCSGVGEWPVPTIRLHPNAWDPCKRPQLGAPHTFQAMCDQPRPLAVRTIWVCLAPLLGAAADECRHRQVACPQDAPCDDCPRSTQGRRMVSQLMQQAAQ